VCFDPREVDAFRAHLRSVRHVPVPGSRFPALAGTLDGQPVGLLRLPFGDRPELLARVVRGLVATLAPSEILAAGTAMACAPDLAVGDVVAITSAAHQGRVVELERGLAAEAQRAAPHAIRVREARALTVPAFVGDAATAADIAACHPDADVVEMEDFHVAALAGTLGVRYGSLRVVTDRGDRATHMERLESAAATLVWLVRRLLRGRRTARHLAVVDNPPTRDLPYRILVRTPGRRPTIPEAVALARHAIRWFGLPALVPPGSRVDVVVAGAPDLARHRASPSGRARVVEREGEWILAHEPGAPGTAPEAPPRPPSAPDAAAGAYVRVVLTGAVAAAPPAAAIDAVGLLAAAPVVAVERLAGAPECGPIPPLAAGVHMQGLNSISAEPEEGLLAATTVDELRASGVPVTDAAAARLWIYRSAHASESSYFHPEYRVPMRACDQVPPGTFLAVTGLGPAIDPAAPGGADADLLVLGDEQGGRALQYLEDMASGPITAEAVFRYDGVIHRLGEAVALSRPDRRLLLTRDGLNSLRFDPVTLRQVYSHDYDRFLEGYFGTRRGRARPARASHLLLTSRGCGYNCSFCCSGGLQPFSALEPDVFVRMLAEIKELHRLGPGEHVDIYLLDSYFNRNPDRVIRIADSIEASGLRGSFELYVRHNGLQGFLARRASAGSPPIVNRDLIRAYRRLGIDEVVMGVDAYTDASIRMLKTSATALARQGEKARPLYTFADIEAVVAALEDEGLDSRGFLLAYNPFAGDVDRLETFYNLGRLALRHAGFRIDSGSSARVNELKPFAGAPLTRVAAMLPGLIRGDRFDYSTPLGRLEDLMDFPMFGERRREPARRIRFLEDFQAARARLADRVDSRLADLSAVREADRLAIAAAARRFVAEETDVGPLVWQALAVDTRLAAAELRLRDVVELIARRLREDALESAEQPCHLSSTFYRLLATV
jgi:nucleoside phosphorylase